MQHYDYWFWNNFLTPKKVKEINSFIEKNFDKDEPIELRAKDSQGNVKSNRESKLILYGKIKKYFDVMFENIYLAIQENFGNIYYPYNDLNYCHLNIYNANKKSDYDWHNDRTPYHKPYDIIFTILVNLSVKKYEGGEFHINNSNVYTIDDFKNPGSVLMFRSSLLHRVTPITKGERRTLTFFLTTPKFK